MASSNSTSSFTAVNDNDFSQLDLNGKIIIKAQYIDDIRRIPIIGDEITYDELILMMQRLFKLQPTDEIHLKYRDDDNDLISIIDDNDLSFAIQYSRILKLKVLVNEKTSSLTYNSYKDLCRELIDIRNRCNKLLEKLHFSGDKNQSGNSNDSSSTTLDTSEVHTQTNEAGEKTEQKTYGKPPKELDPLTAPEASAPKLGLVSDDSSSQSAVESKNTTASSDQQQQSESKPGFSQIAQQPVLQQAYPAPPVRPPVANQFPNQQPPQPGFSNAPHMGFFDQHKPPQMPTSGAPPPPPSSANSFSSDANTPYSRHSLPGANPPYPTGSSYTPGPPGPQGAPNAPSPGGMHQYNYNMPFGPPTSQGVPPPPPSHMIPGPNQSMGHHGPPPSSAGPVFNKPPSSSDGPPMGPPQPQQQQQQQHSARSMPPPSGGPMSPPQLQSPLQPPPSSQASPQGPPQQIPMGGPPGMPGMPQPMGQPPGIPQPSAPIGQPPPPPLMPQFNPRAGYSYQNPRTRYPYTSGI